MLLPASVQCSGSNYSSFLSNKRDSTRKCLLRFSEEFLDPTDKISEWHEDQQSRLFRAIQYRKERNGVGHEFILLLLQREQGGDVDCYCRVERVGDPKHLAEVAFVDGTIAEDYIQAIPLSNPDSTSLTDNSDVVAEITFPQTFMLRDVLAICYGISNHYRAKRYTLQQYNCYFFSWTLVLALARACMNWDVSPSIPEHIANIRYDIMRSIYDQGPARFRSVVYILSNNTLANHENEEHPLDQAVNSWLCSSGFADSITTGLNEVLWADRLHLELVKGIKVELGKLASESVNLTPRDEDQSEVIDSSIAENKRDLDFEYALGRLTKKAVSVVLENTLRTFPQVLGDLSPTCALLKQRLGHEVWCKELVHFFWSFLPFFQDWASERILSSEPVNPHVHRPFSSSIRNLCFIPPSAVLGFSARLLVTSGLSVFIGSKRVERSLKAHEIRNKNVFKRVALCGGTIVRSVALEIGAIPHNFIASKHIVLCLVGEQAAEKLDPMALGLLERLSKDELQFTLKKGLNLALELFDSGLQELIKNTEYQLSLVRPCVAFGINAILDVMDYNLQSGWEDILWHCFLDTMTGLAKRELEGLIGQAHIENIFDVIRKDDEGLSQVGISNLDRHGRVAQPIKVRDDLPCEVHPIASYQRDSWSHQDLQKNYPRAHIPTQQAGNQLCALLETCSISETT
ncbi:hypothetical protein V565_276660 [Rhizoctonia solani 123E]|uniref:Uncharacterized protein n=1 Tax=Rhizoctonia solani 123E TaxID=1423351 RepID=A0A074S5Q9_9AGAM|nr:hypothetical protein V565_276660 [Rhizoctonia solani 123E]